MNLGANPMPFTTSTACLKSGDGVPDQFPVGLRVLVVDDDPTCLKILEKMLRNCLYVVTKCSRAELALKLLRDNKDGFDIVISDVHMPDMDGFKLLERVGLEMDLPVIMMSADDSKNVVMKGVTHGACDYLIKPVRMEALKNIWQHVVRKKKHEWKEKDFENSGSLEEGGRQKRPSEDVDCSSSANEGTSKSSTRKRRDDEDEVEDREDDSSSLKKPRVVWSVELHQQFVTAVNQLGIDKAVPKKILELMNVLGLTRENVASHLQKYRLYLRRLSGQHQNGLGNSFLGPTDSTFGPMATLNGFDLQALASSGQIQPHSLATIQAAALARATNKSTISIPLVDQRNIFSFESPRIRFMDGQPQPQQLNNSSKQVNLLHGIPTNMDSKQLAALHQSSQPFASMNMHVHSQSSQSSSLLTQMVQPQSRTPIINEVSSSHSVHHSSSIGQPVLSQANVVMGRNGIDNVHRPTYTPVSLSPSLGFSMSQRPDFPGNNFPLASNSGIKGTRSSVSNYDVFNELNPKRVDDWGFESTGIDLDSSRLLNMPSRLDVVPSVLVQPGFSSDPKNGNIGVQSLNKAAFSAADDLANTTNRSQQITSNQLDNSLIIKAEKLPDMGFQNNLFSDQFGQDDLVSAFLKQHQEGTLPVENDFSFDGYHLDNLPV